MGASRKFARDWPHSGIVYSKAGFSCGSMVHCKKQNYCLGLSNRMLFLAGSAQVCNRKPPVQGLLALGSSFCGARENEVYEAIGPGPISPGQFFLRAPRYLAAARIL